MALGPQTPNRGIRKDVVARETAILMREEPMPIITIGRDGDRILAKPGETILEALYAAGYAYRTGCRRGGCAICKVDVTAGTVSYNRPVAANVLTDEERAENITLSCRAVPDVDITIEMRDESLSLNSPLLRRLRAV